MSERVSHEWVRARFRVWAAGLLDVREHESIEAHLAECESCRNASRGLSSASAGVRLEEHIPSTMLAEWTRLAPQVSGELRALIQHHLERCEDCRRELETLGLDPRLIARKGSEPHAHAGSGGPVPSQVLPGRVAKLAPDRHAGSRRFQWIPRLAIATAVLALIAVPAVLNLVAKRQPHEDSRLARTPPMPRHVDDGTPTAHAEPTLLALGPGGKGVSLDAGNLRGASRTPPLVVSFDSLRHEIAFAPPGSLALAEGDRVQLTVLDDAGTPRLSLDTTMEVLFSAGRPSAIVIRQGQPPLVAGRYALIVRVMGRSGTAAEESRYSFEIR